MANVDREGRGRDNGSIVPWLVGLAILLVIVGWMLWRNNRLPDVEGRAPGELPAMAIPISPGSR